MTPPAHSVGLRFVLFFSVGRSRVDPHGETKRLEARAIA